MILEMEMIGLTLAALISTKDAEGVFRAVFVAHLGQNLQIINEGDGGGCDASGGGTIICGSGVEPGEDWDDWGLIIHELSHKYDQRGGVTASEILENGIIVDGVNIVGTGYGFQTNKGSDPETTPFQQHANGGTGEEFSDMFMNFFYTYNGVGPLGFTNDIFGAARMDWITPRLESWTSTLYGSR